MKNGIFAFLTLAGIACFFSCAKDKSKYICSITGEMDTAISGLSVGLFFTINYQYDNQGRLVIQNNASYTYGNGFVTCPDASMGPPDTIYLNANGYPSRAGGITYIYDNGNHLIKELFSSGGYLLFTWENGDQIASVGYSANGAKTGAATYYTYYGAIPFQLTKPNYIYFGVNSSHMLQNETDITNYNDVLANYSYTYSFDNAGRASGYKLYDIDSISPSKIDTDVWVTNLSYNCPD